MAHVSIIQTAARRTNTTTQTLSTDLQLFGIWTGPLDLIGDFKQFNCDDLICLFSAHLLELHTRIMCLNQTLHTSTFSILVAKVYCRLLSRIFWSPMQGLRGLQKSHFGHLVTSNGAFHSGWSGLGQKNEPNFGHFVTIRFAFHSGDQLHKCKMMKIRGQRFSRFVLHNTKSQLETLCIPVTVLWRLVLAGW